MAPAGIGPMDLTAARLVSFEACDELVGFAQEAALPRVGPWGFEGPGLAGFAVGGARAMTEALGAGDAAAGAPAPGAAPAAPTPQAGVDYSGTNVQEAGVDEPDVVKTDGRRIVAVAKGRLHVIDPGTEGPVAVGSVALPAGWRHELFLAGDRAIVLSTGVDGGGPVGVRAEPGFEGGTVVDGDAPISDDVVEPLAGPPGPYGGTTRTTLTEVDLDALAVTGSIAVDGDYVTARLVDGAARVVVRSHPAALGPAVVPDGRGTSEDEAREQNRAAVAATTAADWLPALTVTDGDVVVAEGPAVACEDVHHPAEPAGLGTVTVLTVDVDGPMTLTGSTAVLADAEVVYASAAGLYVATNRWMSPEVERRIAEGGAAALAPVEEHYSTEIHRFDITAPDTAAYRGSGTVRGHVLNQWALSEHEGHLRVATTEGSPWGGGSESFVTVLAERDGALHQVGQVGGLGRDERIYSVRFMGDVGFVVTFRETDPLYTLDLADPADPRVLGELKIMGYSAYLHPLGDGYLLGVGQDATEEGMRLGTQLSVFDVRDLAAPTRVHQHTIEQAGSEAEYDHRAFLYWAPTGLTVLPLHRHIWDERARVEAGFVGAVGFRVDPAAGIVEVGTVTHPGGSYERSWDVEWTPEVEAAAQAFSEAGIRRSLVVGDRVFTLSESGLLASDLATLAPRGWLALAG